MRYVNLGNTGLRVSRVALGMMSFGRHESRRWALDEAAAEPIVKQAVDGGVIFFDTADVYNGGQSEIVTGRLLGKLFGSREEYVVATKVHGRSMPGPSLRSELIHPGSPLWPQPQFRRRTLTRPPAAAAGRPPRAPPPVPRPAPRWSAGPASWPTTTSAWPSTVPTGR